MISAPIPIDALKPTGPPLPAIEWDSQQTQWTEWIEKLKGIHFTKVIAIVRPHCMDNGHPHPHAWKPLALSNEDCEPMLWQRTDWDGNKSMIDENQELLNDWRSQEYLSGDAKVLAKFHFFQDSFTILQRFGESEWKNQECAIVGCNKERIVVAQKFRTAWIVMQATRTRYWKDPGYTKAPLAYEAAYKAVLRDIIQMESTYIDSRIIAFWMRNELNKEISNNLIVGIILRYWITFLY